MYLLLLLCFLFDIFYLFLVSVTTLISIFEIFDAVLYPIVSHVTVGALIECECGMGWLEISLLESGGPCVYCCPDATLYSETVRYSGVVSCRLFPLLANFTE